MITMYAVAVIVTIIHLIVTKTFSFEIWIMVLAVNTAIDIYKAIQLKTKKAITEAITLALADIAFTFFVLKDIYSF